jgi:hypothetical protein
MAAMLTSLPNEFPAPTKNGERINSPTLRNLFIQLPL